MRYAARSSSGGADLAAIWLNMVKILIGLVFAYQQTLSGQLGLDLFDRIQYYVLLPNTDEVGVADTSEGGNGKNVITNVRQAIVPDNPYFLVSFLPISLLESYLSCELSIDQVIHLGHGGEQTAFGIGELHEQERVRFFSSPERGEHALQSASFNMDRLLTAVTEPPGGEYKIRFKVRFFDRPMAEVQGLSEEERGAIALHKWPILESEAVGFGSLSLVTAEGANTIDLIYQRPDTSAVRIGDLPLVEGRTIEFPMELAGKWFVADDYRNSSPLWTGVSSETPISVDNENDLFKATSKLRFNQGNMKENYHRIRGHYYPLTIERIDGNSAVARVVADEAGIPSEPVTIDLARVPGDVRSRLMQGVRVSFPGKEFSALRVVEGERVDAIITFVVQPNLKPRPIASVDRIVIVYPNDFAPDEENRMLVDLRKYIVDPDGQVSLYPQRLSIEDRPAYLEIYDRHWLNVADEDALFDDPTAVSGDGSDALQIVTKTVYLVAGDEFTTTRIPVELQCYF